MLSALLTLTTVLYITITVRCDSGATPTPIVGIEMSSTGFHRDLVYAVQFDYPLAGKECEYLLEQPLPSAVYVSVDQLNEMQRLRRLNAVYPAFVDTETTTENSESLTVLLKGMPKITDTLKLPIHFRYHDARPDEKTHVQVQIEIPTMYLNCAEENDNDLIERDLLQQPNIRFCLDEHTQSLVVAPPPMPPKMSSSSALTVDSHSDKSMEQEEENMARSSTSSSSISSSRANCNWRQINVDFQLNTPLQADIPVGNSHGYPPVLYATIIISWVVSLWTVFRTSAVPRRINQKLEEQRILQRKMK